MISIRMVYKLGRRRRQNQLRVKFLGMVLLIGLLAGALTTVYADSHGISLSPLTAQMLHGHPAAVVGAASGKAVSHKAPTAAIAAAAAAAASTARKAAAQAATAASTTPAAATSVRTSSCALFPPAQPGLQNAITPELRKLAQYEQLCGGALAARSSFFEPTPATVADAQSDAADVASTLKEYAAYGIKPLVFLEPDGMDLNQYQAGAYDSALDAYFKDIKAAGITDAMMGMWVILPEGNIPVWSSVDPNVFAADVTKTVQFQKKYFPGSLATIMLDSESYPTGASWGDGHYVSLLPYVQNIPKGLIDSFGLQGFPWAPAANVSGEATLYNPNIYLRTDFAAEAARSLGVSSIWFNTGTFHQMYTQDSTQTITASPAQRQAMLDGTIAEAKGLQGQGFSVSIHLFAENKASTSEAIDWSYWQTTPGSDANTTVFTTFVHDATTANIPIWLFDTNEHSD
jgi:hypothetical protein